VRLLPPLEPKITRNLVTLFLTALLFWTSITLLVPTLPAYIADIGGDKKDIGFVMGAFAIGLVVTRARLGKLSDQRGRKLVLRIGALVAAIAPLGYLAARTIPLLFVTRAFHGISMAAFTTAYSALVVDLSPFQYRGELIGYMSLAVPIGMAFGPALGSFLQESRGYETLFLVSTLLGTLALLLSNLVREKRFAAQSQGDKLVGIPSRSMKKLFWLPAFLVPAAILFLIGLLFGGIVTFLPLYIREQQLNISAGLFYTYAAIASFIGRVISGKASDTLGRGIFVTGSLIFYLLSMLVLAFMPSETGVILGAFLEGFGGGILIPLLIALISDRSYLTERGKVYAICLGGFDLGMAISGPILGFIDVDYSTMFAFASSFAAIGLGIFLGAANPTPLSSLKFACGIGEDRYRVAQEPSK
jgi:MFS family permease